MVSAFHDEEDEHVFQIVGMWVAPEARREGIGRRLLVEVENWIESCGGTEIHLGVTNVATAARRLYETAGYAPDGREDPSRHTPGVVEIRMRKRLT